VSFARTVNWHNKCESGGSYDVSTYHDATKPISIGQWKMASGIGKQFMDGKDLKGKHIFAFCIAFLVIFGVVSLFLAQFGSSNSWKFMLAFFPLVVVLLGVAALGQSGLRMAGVGLALVIVLAVFQFGTPVEVAFGASVYGFLKSFGISISVAATMLMIFIMKEAGALEVVSKVIKRQMVEDETRALYIGIGFGSFLSSLGVVTPSLFPPLLLAMGFTPVASIAIAVLGYNATTSFSLLSIPITLPASSVSPPLNPIELAFKISIFLPIVSVGLAFALLWIVGGRRSMLRGVVPALICGLVLAFGCLGAVGLDYFSGVEYIPLQIVGVFAGFCAMLSLLIYQRITLSPKEKTEDPNYPSKSQILRAFSPWIMLTAIAAVGSLPMVASWLGNVFGHQTFTVFADRKVSLEIPTQIYTWIFTAVVLSLFTLRPTKGQLKKAADTWIKRFAGPFLAYSLYFCIAYVMSYSSMVIVGGALGHSGLYDQQNMNVILGSTLAAVFGTGYVFVAASLGLFGAIVGGSETSSNVLFLNIQRTAAHDIGLNSSGFMTIYGSHAVAGGIASAVTPAKINNAVVTIDESRQTESLIMRKHLFVAVILTVATGILTGILVGLGV
jgi:lactate permease